VLHRELAARANRLESKADRCITRAERLRIARTVWRDLGGFRTDVIRNEFIDLTGRIGLAHVTAPKTLRHTSATILQDANVDPLIRNELMGHVPAISPAPGAGLGMTAVYTHTRPETKRRQLENALADRAVIQHATRWLQARCPPPTSDAAPTNPPEATPDRSGGAMGIIGRGADRPTSTLSSPPPPSLTGYL
jgi:hypothetical protein